MRNEISNLTLRTLTRQWDYYTHLFKISDGLIIYKIGIGTNSDNSITTILKNSPAELAGLKVGDILISVDQNIIESEKFLKSYLNESKNAGKNVKIKIKRDNGQEYNFDILPEKTDFYYRYNGRPTFLSSFSEKEEDYNNYGEHLSLNFLAIGQIAAIFNFNETKSLGEIEKMTKYSIEPTGVRLQYKFGGFLIAEDSGHGLVFSLTDLGKMEWSEANKACQELVLNGYDDWELPTAAELKSICIAEYPGIFGIYYGKIPCCTGYWGELDPDEPFNPMHKTQEQWSQRERKAQIHDFMRPKECYLAGAVVSRSLRGLGVNTL